MSLPRRSVPSISVARTAFSPGKEHQGDTVPVDYFDDDDEPEPWLDFTEDLAARLGDLKTGVFEFIELEVPERGWHGHLLTYTATSSGRVRCVVPNSALSHRSREEWTPYHQQFVAAGWRYKPRNTSTSETSGGALTARSHGKASLTCVSGGVCRIRGR